MAIDVVCVIYAAANGAVADVIAVAIVFAVCALASSIWLSVRPWVPAVVCALVVLCVCLLFFCLCVCLFV